MRQKHTTQGSIFWFRPEHEICHYLDRAALASAGRRLFFAPDLPTPDGPTVSNVLEEFSAVSSERL